MDLTGLFVRIPSGQAQALDRRCNELGVTKQSMIRGLLDELLDGAGAGTTEEAAVLTLAEVAALLRVKPEAVEARARSGDLPGRRLDGDWRFSRAAVLEWLGRGEPSSPRSAGFSPGRRVT